MEDALLSNAELLIAVIGLLLSALVTGVGFYLRGISSRLLRVETAHLALQMRVADNHPTRAELSALEVRFRQMLEDVLRPIGEQLDDIREGMRQ